MSIQGTLGPLVQGSSPSGPARTRIAAAFVAAFVAGAVATFALFSIAGVNLGFTQIPFRWRVGVAGAALLPLAAADLLAVRRATYCPISWRRQTPRRLMRRHSTTVVALVWGFDTGLVVTTFRVAAVSWGALLLATLGLLPWWAGCAYGLGFTVPFAVLLFRARLGRCSRQRAAEDPGLESMLGKRAAVQLLSAALLVTSSAVLISSWLP